MLAKGAGSLLRGMGSSNLEEKEYEQIDPRKAYWQGLAMDMGNAVAGTPYQGMAGQQMAFAQNYNLQGPERLRAQQAHERQQQAAELMKRVREQQLKRGQIQDAQDQQTTAQYQQYVAQTAQQGGTPLPREAWEAQLGHKASGTTAKIENTLWWQQATPEARKMFLEANNERAMGLTDPNTAAALSRIAAAADAEAEDATKWAATNQAFDNYMGTEYVTQAQSLDEMKSTGLITGRVSPWTTEAGAAQQARSILATLDALQIVNLAPVTEAEIALLQQMAEDPKATVASNVGRLKTMVGKIERALKTMESRDKYFQEKGTLKGYRAPRGGSKAWGQRRTHKPEK
jgi:hypothetical protein